MNAACEQYGEDCPLTLPFTGFDALDWFVVGAVLLALGVYLALRLRERRG